MWGVDSSEEMLAEARARPLPGGGWKRAEAERLPFRDRWFDAAVFRQAIHLVDRPRALREAARVLRPGGRLVVATFHPDHFDAVWIARVFPRVAELDRARFPRPEALRREIAAASFTEPTLTRLQQAAPLTRAEALERIRGRFISTLHLLDDAELAAGLARAERELPPVVDSTLDWLLLSAARKSA